MSDQLFLGLSPKSEAGKSYMFMCMDNWIEIHRFIRSEVSDEFPPHPSMDEETAELLADRLQKKLDFGIPHAYFVLTERNLTLQEPDENPEDDSEILPWPDETSDFVVRMVGLLEEYILFLRECGGCKVADCDYGL